MMVEEMKAMDMRTVDLETLMGATQIKINDSLPKKERMKEFLLQIKNPYCFHWGM